MLPSGGVNFESTNSPCNVSIYALLQPRLDKNFKTSCHNSQLLTGSDILRDIYISFSDSVAYTTRGSAAYTAIHSLSWDLTKSDLNTLNTLFNTHLSAIREADMSFNTQDLKMCWIQALPKLFVEVSAKFKQGLPLPTNFQMADTVITLYQATKHYVTIFNIKINQKQKAPTPLPTQDPRDAVAVQEAFPVYQ